MSDSGVLDQVLSLFSQNRDAVGVVSGSELERYNLYVVENDDVVGGALVEPLDDKYALVHTMAVKESHRGQGVGGQLVGEIAADVDSERLQVKCQVDLPANEFYEQTGWTRVRQTGDGRMNVWEYDV